MGCQSIGLRKPHSAVRASTSWNSCRQTSQEAASLSIAGKKHFVLFRSVRAIRGLNLIRHTTRHTRKYLLIEKCQKYARVKAEICQGDQQAQIKEWVHALKGMLSWRVWNVVRSWIGSIWFKNNQSRSGAILRPYYQNTTWHDKINNRTLWGVKVV